MYMYMYTYMYVYMYMYMYKALLRRRPLLDERRGAIRDDATAPDVAHVLVLGPLLHLGDKDHVHEAASVAEGLLDLLHGDVLA